MKVIERNIFKIGRTRLGFTECNNFFLENWILDFCDGHLLLIFELPCTFQIEIMWQSEGYAIIYDYIYLAIIQKETLTYLQKPSEAEKFIDFIGNGIRSKYMLTY